MGETVAAARVGAGLTQEEVAQRLQRLGVDVDRKAVSKIETGLRCVTDWEVFALATVLGRSTDSLFAPECATRAFIEQTSSGR